MSYAKPWLSLGDQLAQLKTRGMLVTNDAAALKALETVGYYRLSAYWHPMRKSEQITVGPMVVSTRLTDNFVAGATFDLVLELCDFDRKLKMILLEAIERVEISVRTQLAHTLGKDDPFGHVNHSSLHGNFTKKANKKTGKTLHATWLEKYEKQLRQSKEEFVTHFKSKYGSMVPIWVAIELFDFGQTSFLYSGLTVRHQRDVAVAVGVPDRLVLASWLKTLNYVRNLTAHHARLWNRNLTVQPSLPTVNDIPELGHLHMNPVLFTSRLYAVACILAFLVAETDPQSTWTNRFVDLMQTFPVSSHKPISITAMGFPDRWEHEAPWA